MITAYNNLQLFRNKFSGIEEKKQNLRWVNIVEISGQNLCKLKTNYNNNTYRKSSRLLIHIS